MAGYVFRATPAEAIARNRTRIGGAAIPIPGILGTFKRLEEPSIEEGFDVIYSVTLTPSNVFVVVEIARAMPS